MLCKNRMRAIIAYYGLESQKSQEWVRDGHPSRVINAQTNNIERVAEIVRDETVANVINIIQLNPNAQGTPLVMALKTALAEIDRAHTQ